MLEYAATAGGVMKRSSGQPIANCSRTGVPSNELENRSSLAVFLGVLPETEGRNGRNGPRGILKLSFSKAPSVSAPVPTDARSRTRLRSCSRMTDDEE